MSELPSRFGVHPTMIDQWKRALLDGASGVFERGGRKAPVIDEDQVRICMPRSESWRWPTLSGTKAEVLGREVMRHWNAIGPRDDAERHGRTRPSGPVDRPAARSAAGPSFVLLLYAAR
ncbi:hypothetical protein FLP41_16990 [Paracoccus marcusii]|uniref:hypothetical protein n=1 Tax=Paracoccus marcusii TaxID=59779 RepID=UPI002ED34A43|nr:hypothetical protein FLP41_16990 [Paracoccus marcusii]